MEEIQRVLQMQMGFRLPDVVILQRPQCPPDKLRGSISTRSSHFTEITTAFWNKSEHQEVSKKRKRYIMGCNIFFQHTTDRLVINIPAEQ